MSKHCPICDKGSKTGGHRNLLRGKYNPTKHVRKYPNLQWARLPAKASAKAGRSRRIKICTGCLKKNKHLNWRG